LGGGGKKKVILQVQVFKSLCHIII